MDDLIPFLKATLPLVWCRDTASLSTQGHWSDLNPALGQSDVTALLVQQLCGGEIVRTFVRGYGAHYFNRLPVKASAEDGDKDDGAGDSPHGTEVDLTDMQYPEGTIIPPGYVVTRQDMLKGYIAKRLQIPERYDLLMGRYERYVVAPLVEPDSD